MSGWSKIAICFFPIETTATMKALIGLDWEKIKGD